MVTKTADPRSLILEKFLYRVASGKSPADFISKEIALMVMAFHQAIYPRDPVSGFIQSKDIKPLVKHTLDGRELEVICVGADLSNLRGLNLILSGQDISKNAKDEITKEADQLFGMITEIFKEELEKVAPHNASGENPNVMLFHPGGDEIFAIIVREKTAAAGESRIGIQDAIKNINDRTSKLVRELGLDNIMHAKYQNKFERRGVGLTVAAEEIKDQKDLDSYLDKIEAKIETLKKDAKKHSRKRRAADQGLQPGEAPREKRRTIPKMPHILVADSDSLKLGGMDIQFSTERLISTRNAIRARYATEGPVLNQYTTQDLPFEIIAPNECEGLKECGFAWIHPAQQRKHVVEKTIQLMDSTPYENSLLRMAHSKYERHRSKRSFTCEPIEKLVDNYFLYKSGLPTDLPVYLVAYEVQNFSGLNRRFEHEGCDEIFAHLVRGIEISGRKDRNTINKEIPMTGNNQQPITCHPGGKGSIVYALVPGRTPEEVHLAIQAHIASAEQYISAKYADPESPQNNLLRGLENPRRPEKPGVRIVATAVPLHKDAKCNTKSVMQQIRSQLNKNIDNDLLFDGNPIGIDQKIGNNDFIRAAPSMDASLGNLVDAVGTAVQNMEVMPSPDAHSFSAGLASKMPHAKVRTSRSSKDGTQR